MRTIQVVRERRCPFGLAPYSGEALAAKSRGSFLEQVQLYMRVSARSIRGRILLSIAQEIPNPAFREGRPGVAENDNQAYVQDSELSIPVAYPCCE